MSVEVKTEDLATEQGSSDAVKQEALATEQRQVAKLPCTNAVYLLVDFLTEAAIDFCHDAFESKKVDVHVLEKVLQWMEDCFDDVVFDEESMAKHVELINLMRKDKSGDAKEFLFLVWSRKRVNVRERVLASRPAAPLLQSTAATGTPLLQSTAPTLSEDETSL